MLKPFAALALLCVLVPGQFKPMAYAYTGAAPAPAETANQVIQWNRTLLAVLRTAGAQPATVHSTRSYAMLHVAIYDAVNAIDQSHASYHVHLRHVSRRASKNAAAAQAAHDVLVALYPTFQTSLDTQLESALAEVPDGASKEEGVRIGRTVAAQIIALRSTDGSAMPPPAFTQGTLAGDYRSTPPNFPTAQLTQWADVQLWALPRANVFRPAPPPVLSSHTYTRVFNEVKNIGVGSSPSAVRTADQTAIGQFWNGTIQNYWNEITQTAALERHLSLAETARVFALVNISLADTAIAFYDAKYFYHFWRPVTAVQSAADDGNLETTPDPAWLPLTTRTAGDPSYPGAHSAVSSAAAAVLAAELGDRIRLAVTSEATPGVTRNFTSFSAVATEAGLSRIYAGQHFRTDHNAGSTLGNRVGRFVLFTQLTPREREHDHRTHY